MQLHGLGGFPGGSEVKNLPAIPGSGRSPEEGNGNPLQCSCLGNPMDRGAWQTTVMGSRKSQTRLRLNGDNMALSKALNFTKSWIRLLENGENVMVGLL